MLQKGDILNNEVAEGRCPSLTVVAASTVSVPACHLKLVPCVYCQARSHVLTRSLFPSLLLSFTSSRSPPDLSSSVSSPLPLSRLHRFA